MPCTNGISRARWAFSLASLIDSARGVSRLCGSLVDVGRVEEVGRQAHALEQLQAARRGAGQHQLDRGMGALAVT